MANALGRAAGLHDRGGPTSTAFPSPPWSAPEHARQADEAGVDMIVAQGTEAGGHCGEVSTLVLVPEVSTPSRRRRTCRCWPPAASSPAGRWRLHGDGRGGCLDGFGLADDGGGRDRARTPCRRCWPRPHATPSVRAGRTGKPSRQLVSDWTDAWTPNDGGQQRFRCPCSRCWCEPVLRRVDQLAETGIRARRRRRPTSWAGRGPDEQGQPAREVVLEFIEDYVAAAERLGASLDD